MKEDMIDKQNKSFRYSTLTLSIVIAILGFYLMDFSKEAELGLLLTFIAIIGLVWSYTIARKSA